MKTQVLSDKLEKEYHKIIATINRLDRISKKPNIYIANKDIDSFYDGVFLKSVTLFEAFLEDIFIGLLYNKYQLPTRKKVQKLIFPNRQLTLNYLIKEKKYFTALPYENLKINTKYFFKTDNPFSSLQNTDVNLLKEVTVIRNAIAHNSGTASTKYKKFINNKHNTLPRNRRTPSKFLQSLQRQNQTMFKQYIIELNSIAYKIATF